MSLPNTSILDISILDSIKRLLGISDNDTSFDTDIIIHINSAFMALFQMGVGPDKNEAFIIESNEESWNLFTIDNKDIEAVKTFIYLKVKLIFDPPNNSSVIELFKQQISELEFRLNLDHELKN